MVYADVGLMEQLLMNLAVHARDAMPRGGTLTIESGLRFADEKTSKGRPNVAAGPYAWIKVADTGEGMRPEVLARIFEPFFTTKERGRGTGLGLATSFGIVEQHHGWIDVASEVGTGSTFEVFIPLRESIAEKNDESRRSVRGGRETLLLVEDDPRVRRITRRLVAAQGYGVIEAESGEEALRVWTEHESEIALVLTDIVMPGAVDGRELARRLVAVRPTLRVVFMSGYSAEVAGSELSLRDHEAFLAKPFTRDELLDTIRRALDA